MSLAHNHHHHAHCDLTNRAAIASVTMALFLLALKIFAAAETGSVALLASLAELRPVKVSCRRFSRN